MHYVIAEPCVSTCDTACVNVCPVDAIQGPRSIEEIRALPPDQRDGLQLFIHPDICISCGACEMQCPVQAIFEESALPPKWAHYAEKNAAFFRPRASTKP